MEEINYLGINNKSWNNGTDTHLKSEFYDLKVFLRGKSSINRLFIKSMQEFDCSPYNCFNNIVEFEPEKYRIKGLDNKIPMLYAIEATKN